MCTSTTVNVTVSAGYNGPLNLSAWDKNGTRLAGWHKNSASGDEAFQLKVELSRPGDISVTFTATNDVSRVKKESHIVVVGEFILRKTLCLIANNRHMHARVYNSAVLVQSAVSLLSSPSSTTLPLITYCKRLQGGWVGPDIGVECSDSAQVQIMM